MPQFPSRRLLAATLFSAVLNATAGAAQPPAIGATVRMTSDFEFDPRAVTVHAGQAVEWRNVSRFMHTVTDDPRLGNAALPPGAEPFASGDVRPGGTYLRVLTVPGTYRYFCTPHEGVGMTGTITVLSK
jgi:plastocyanin